MKSPKVRAGKRKRLDWGNVSPEVADMLHQLHQARKLKKEKKTRAWKLAAHTANNPFILIATPQR